MRVQFQGLGVVSAGRFHILGATLKEMHMVKGTFLELQPGYMVHHCVTNFRQPLVYQVAMGIVQQNLLHAEGRFAELSFSQIHGAQLVPGFLVRHKSSDI